MSSQGSNNFHDWNIQEAERRMTLNLDLNYPPPDEYMVPGGPFEEYPQDNGDHQGRATYKWFIDSEVAIVCPSRFVQATNNPQRNHHRNGCGVLDGINRAAEFYDLTSWSLLTQNLSVAQQEQTVHTRELSLNSGGSDGAGAYNASMPAVVLQGESKPAASGFRCAICLGQLIEETSTKCGHIFCKDCIEAAIATQHKCPTCRHKLKKRDIIRVYLPSCT